MSFLGAPYPIIPHPRGFLRTIPGINAIRADLLLLLQTTPGERVMLPTYGTDLKSVLFDQNDGTSINAARNAIIESITNWEPRIVVSDLTVNIGDGISDNNLNRLEEGDKQHIMFISIEFSLLSDITEVQSLTLEIPLSG
jgi:phage baseplate assembly protein W